MKYTLEIQKLLLQAQNKNLHPREKANLLKEAIRIAPVTGRLLAGFGLIFVAVLCSETKFGFLRKKSSQRKTCEEGG